MKILVTNDDGYRSPGLLALVGMAKRMGEVTVIAPKYHQSGVALAVTMGYQPIAVKELGLKDGVRWLYLDGTPASCVKFAIDEVFKDGKPDLVLSGVNHGMNAATAACYSATLGAAQEAAINGIPAVGVSIDSMADFPDFSAVEELFPDLLRRILETHGGRFGTFYNVNFPNLPAKEIKGVRVGHLGIGHWEDEFEAWDIDVLRRKGVDLAKYKAPEDPVVEPGERLYLMVGHFVDDPRNTPGADHHLVGEGYVSIVAHNFDNTDSVACKRLCDNGFNLDF